MAGGGGGAVQRFKGTFGGVQLVGEGERKALEQHPLAADLPVELRPMRQRGKGRAQVSFRPAVKVSLTSEAAKAGKEGEGQEFAAGESRRRAGTYLGRQWPTKGVRLDVKMSENSFPVKHRATPFGSCSLLASGSLF
jgi:hypothetical protein